MGLRAGLRTLVWMLALPCGTEAAVSFTDEQQACLGGMEMTSSAFRQQQWAEMEQYATIALQNCESISVEQRANLYLFLAVANYQQGKFSSTLVATEQCINRDYYNAQCHLERAIALKALKRVKEANFTRQLARQIAQEQIRRLTIRLSVASSQAEENDLRSRLRQAQDALTNIDQSPDWVQSD